MPAHELTAPRMVHGRPDGAALRLLECGEVEIEGRMPWSSNATFLTAVRSGDAECRAVYKPGRGERPLWDFPNGLYRREVAAYLLSEALGWGLVPPTLIREGPLGEGSFQLFIEADFEQHYFTLYEQRPDLHPQLLAMGAYDVLANNTDRKSGHVLLGPGDRIWGVDQGLCFAADFKLRTVIWDFGGEELPPSLLATIEPLASSIPWTWPRCSTTTRPRPSSNGPACCSATPAYRSTRPAAATPGRWSEAGAGALWALVHGDHAGCQKVVANATIRPTISISAPTSAPRYGGGRAGHRSGARGTSGRRRSGRGSTRPRPWVGTGGGAGHPPDGRDHDHEPDEADEPARHCLVRPAMVVPTSLDRLLAAEVRDDLRHVAGAAEGHHQEEPGREVPEPRPEVRVAPCSADSADQPRGGHHDRAVSPAPSTPVEVQPRHRAAPYPCSVSRARRRCCPRTSRTFVARAAAPGRSTNPEWLPGMTSTSSRPVEVFVPSRVSRGPASSPIRTCESAPRRPNDTRPIAVRLPHGHRGRRDPSVLGPAEPPDEQLLPQDQDLPAHGVEHPTVLPVVLQAAGDVSHDVPTRSRSTPGGP